MNENYDYTALLEYDTKQELYELTLTTFNGRIDRFKFEVFLTTREHAMRMHLVSQQLYNTSKWVGSLCELNDILNPFSLKENELILYLPQSDLVELLKVPDSIKNSGVLSKVKSDLKNLLKKKKPDVGRAKFLQNRNDVDLLPPSIAKNDTPQIVVENGKIKIAANTYQNPNTAITEEVKGEVINEQQIERILVNRYFKKL